MTSYIKEGFMAQEFVSLYSNSEHVSRHFSDAATVGSKFFAATQDIVLERAEEAMREKFDAAQAEGREAGRVVITLHFDSPIGSDALVSLPSQPEAHQIRVIRDAATPSESIVTAVRTTKDGIPNTSEVTVIAGPYGPTGKWGIYTMFPGQEAPPFPNERQPEDVRESYERFWQTHGFLATQEEIEAHPKAYEPIPIHNLSRSEIHEALDNEMEWLKGEGLNPEEVKLWETMDFWQRASMSHEVMLRLEGDDDPIDHWGDLPANMLATEAGNWFIKIVQERGLLSNPSKQEIPNIAGEVGNPQPLLPVSKTSGLSLAAKLGM
jgi:hypothetical protein